MSIVGIGFFIASSFVDHSSAFAASASPLFPFLSVPSHSRIARFLAYLGVAVRKSRKNASADLKNIFHAIYYCNSTSYRIDKKKPSIHSLPGMCVLSLTHHKLDNKSRKGSSNYGNGPSLLLLRQWFRPVREVRYDLQRYCNGPSLFLLCQRFRPVREVRHDIQR